MASPWGLDRQHLKHDIFTARGQCESNVSYVLDLPVSGGVQRMDFGTIPETGAKVVAVHYEATVRDAASIHLSINESQDSIELRPGGFFLYFSPTPTAGISALSFTHTTGGRVKIWLIG